MAVGLLSTAAMPQDLMRKSFSAMITRLMPNGSAPLFALTALLRDETALQIEHGYYSKTMIFPKITLSANALVGALTLTIDTSDTTQTTYANLVKGDLLRNGTTGEIVMFESISGPTVTVKRNVGWSGAVAMTSGDVLYHVGNAFEEGSVRPAAVQILAVRNTNYTQIFRNSWSVSKTLAAIPMIAGNGQVQESKQDCAALHAMSIEKALFWGQKQNSIYQGQPFHTMDGIFAIIAAQASGNITIVNNGGSGSQTTWTTFEAALEKTLQTQTDPKGSPIRTVFCGGVAKRTITNVARLNSQYMIEQDSTGKTTTEWGLRITTINTPRGTFEIVDHPLFNAYGQASPLAATAVVVDLDAINLAYLRKTEDMQYNNNGTPVDNGIDAQGGTLTTELTLLIKNPQAFGILYGVQSPAAG